MFLPGMSAAGPVAREAGARTRREPALPPIPGVGPLDGRRRGRPGQASFGDPPGGNARRGRIGRRPARAVRGAVSPLRGERGTPGAGASLSLLPSRAREGTGEGGSGHGSRRARLLSSFPRCHPGLVPGSRLSGAALARFPPDPGTGSGTGRGPGQAWTPEQVRGDNGGRGWSRPWAGSLSRS